MTTLQDLLKNRGKSLADLARAIPVNKATVTRWNKKGVPADRLADIEKATGILPCDLRPDLAPMFARGSAQ